MDSSTKRRNITFASIVATLGVAAMLLLGFGIGLTVPPTKGSLPSCSAEDSTNCYWDARVHGNGTGRSFIDWNGHTYYVEGK